MVIIIFFNYFYKTEDYLNDRLTLINSQIEDQQKVLDELNHKVLLKENELGISKLKELMSKLESAEKQISQLTQKISEKERIILELKDENEKLKLKKFGNIDIDYNNINLEIVGLFTKMDGCEDSEQENKILKEKIKKMKNEIIELSGKLEKELLIKEKKNIKINENNCKIFEDLQKKNKELMKMLKQENMQTMALRKEKYDLETICIKQEESIKLLNKKLNSNLPKRKLRQCIYSHSNIIGQNDGLPKISINGDYNSNMQFNEHNKSSFLPVVK